MTFKSALLAVLLAFFFALSPARADIPQQADAPFRLYSVAEGLNQKTVLALAQDHDGFLWVATFGGLNRFDGRNFESLTARQGLRQNLIQALTVDSKNRLWAGDASGGLSLIENGQVIRTFEPNEDSRGVVRAIVEVGDTLYVGSQPGGIRRLSLNDIDAGLSPVVGAPDEIFAIGSRYGKELLVMGAAGLHRFRIDSSKQFELIDDNVTGLAQGPNGSIAVGDSSGRVGWMGADAVDWLDVNFDKRVSGLVLNNSTIEWVFLDERGMVPFDAPGEDVVLPTSGYTPALYDQEGVLWVPTRAGLARYLGARFRHYSLTTGEVAPEVFAIQPGLDSDYWFGTNNGLLHLDKSGELTNVSDALGIDRREVRDIELARTTNTLWMGQVQGPLYGIDLTTMQTMATLGDESTLTMGLALDRAGRLWSGTFLGTLNVFDPVDQTTTVHTIGNGAAVYSLDMADDNHLWFTANHQGVYRIDTSDPSAKPEKIASEDTLKQEYYAQVVASGEGSSTEVWFVGIQGGTFRLVGGTVSRVIDESELADHTVYSIQPLPEQNFIVATSRGVYRRDLATGALEQYGALDGFVAIEAKVHATHYDGERSLLIGTTSGVTQMDVGLPMNGVVSPTPLITQRKVDDAIVTGNSTGPVEVAVGDTLIEFTAVSMRKPEGIEFSYKLVGQDDDWSAPTRNTSISYSNLSPGEYEFNVRARLPGGEFSEPARWAFFVPTPFWRTSWFMALAAAVLLGLIWSVIDWRLRSVARTNQRLRAEVAERTKSIEAGKRKVELMNEQLSREIAEREKSDELRAEVETRFHQAYQNSPIGMALVDTDGWVYDANPRMKALFWPTTSSDKREPLLRIVATNHRERFQEFLSQYEENETTVTSMEVDCTAFDGRTHRIDFHPSAVRNRDGRLKYIVLLAHDVTESRAMTDQLAYQARFDELTGLINRRAFSERLETIGNRVDADQPAFLMFLDLDQFKVVNDTCGHAAGDELLRMVADGIQGCVREGDTVARLGGDEFALIIAGGTQDIAMQRAEAVRQKIQELEFLWENDVFRIGASIGVVPIGRGVRDLNELQQVADAACYAAKEAGRNRVHLVSGAEDAAHEHRGEMRWVQRLGQAIDTDSFVLYGQRILPIKAQPQRIERIEILLRMRDRNSQRLIPPGAFLPAAERYGLQGRLDLWVVTAVIAAMRSQLDAHAGQRQFWVNLSGASVGDPRIARELIRSVREADLPRGTLNFEITETAVIRKIGEAKQLIASLQAMGCRLALDDFGSGLSSFGYLKELNVDCLKVDGQFVRDINHDATDRIFVKSIIDIAHTLGLDVIAEFVEDNATLATVQELGSDFAQGFGIHRPEPLDDMVSMTTAMQVAGLRPGA